MEKEPFENPSGAKENNQELSVVDKAYKDWATIKDVFTQYLKDKNEYSLESLDVLYDTNKSIQILDDIKREDLIEPYLINRFFQINHDISNTYWQPEISKSLSLMKESFSLFVENHECHKNDKKNDEKIQEKESNILLAYQDKKEIETLISEYIKNREEYSGRFSSEIMLKDPKATISCLKDMKRDDLIDSYMISRFWDYRKMLSLGGDVGSKGFEEDMKKEKMLIEPFLLLVEKYKKEV